MAARPSRTVRRKALHLAFRNLDGVRGRKLELDHFLRQNRVDICPLNETFLNPVQAFLPANYVCHLTDRPTAGGGTAILVRLGTAQNSVPVSGLTHLEATTVPVTLAYRPVKILAAYLSHSSPLIGADLIACFGGGLPVLMAGDLNAKHVGWNSRLTGETPTWLCRREILSDLWTGHPNHQPIQPLLYPYVLVIGVEERRTSRSRFIWLRALL